MVTPPKIKIIQKSPTCTDQFTKYIKITLAHVDADLNFILPINLVNQFNSIEEIETINYLPRPTLVCKL
jgi:hypothetical protein